jgi:hypothetical protein
MQSRILFILILSQLLYFSTAADVNYTIETTWHPQCPFDVNASLSSDLSSLSIIYSTRNVTPNSLVTFGGNSLSSNSKRKCYATVVIDIDSQSSVLQQFYVTAVKIHGSIRLDKGLSASIETGLVYQNDKKMVS